MAPFNASELAKKTTATVQKTRDCKPSYSVAPAATAVAADRSRGFSRIVSAAIGTPIARIAAPIATYAVLQPVAPMINCASGA